MIVKLPGRFDLAQLVVDQLRARLGPHALSSPQLALPDDRPRQTATEIMMRLAENRRLMSRHDD